jgi:hypothetical protein
MFDRDGPPGSDAPPGFEPVEPASPHLRHIGPLWCRVAGDEVVFALRIRPEHLNNRGTAHGGDPHHRGRRRLRLHLPTRGPRTPRRC